jgi:PAS domain S-box-containing protein
MPTPRPDVDERDVRIAALERDVASLRALLAGYMDDRETAEAALVESETRYRQLIDRAAYGIYRASPDGRFLEVNPALVTMLGYASADELRAVDAARDIYRDAAEAEALMARIRGGVLADWPEVEWRRKDGSPITVRVSARIVRDEAGGEIYVEAIAEDVTERNRRDTLLRRSERMASLGHTLAGVAHELNNPLAAVSGFAQLLLREARTEDDRTALETINREATRAGKIVRDLLTFARRQDGQAREPVHVAEVARHILATQRYAMETRGIHHALVAERDLPPVLADPVQLEQVLLNLVVNARQAVEASTEDPAAAAARSGADRPFVALHVRRDGDALVVEVSDNGVGIAPGDLGRIWDPFWSSKAEGDGTGLGLSVVHGIVTAHGGTIDVESDAGRGTRFVIRLPVMAPSPDERPGGRGGPAGAGRSGHDGDRPARPLDILLVEEEGAILGFLTRYFSSRGHAVVTAESGAQALRIAAQATFDVVICGVGTGGEASAAAGGGGAGDLVTRLRALPTCGRTRYVVTAVPDAEERPALAAPGATRVAKPYVIDELRRAVEEG